MNASSEIAYNYLVCLAFPPHEEMHCCGNKERSRRNYHRLKLPIITSSHTCAYTRNSDLYAEMSHNFSFRLCFFPPILSFSLAASSRTSMHQNYFVLLYIFISGVLFYLPLASSLSFVHCVQNVHQEFSNTVVTMIITLVG